LPEVGDTVSQAGVGLTDPGIAATVADAVKAMTWPVVLPTEIVCDAGAAPPSVCAKLSDVGFAVGAPAVTCRVTGITKGLSSTALVLWVIAVIFTWPEYDPAVGGTNASPMFSGVEPFSGMEPEVGSANSQLVPSVVEVSMR
jgi:hypothetical protein